MSKSGGVLKLFFDRLLEKNIGNKMGPPNVGARSHFVHQCWMQSNFQIFFTFCKMAIFIIKFGVGNFSACSSAQYGQIHVRHWGSTTWFGASRSCWRAKNGNVEKNKTCCIINNLLKYSGDLWNQTNPGTARCIPIRGLFCFTGNPHIWGDF